MTDRVLIPLPGVGTLNLTLEAYEAALIPLTAAASQPPAASAEPLVTARVLAELVSLPLSCIYEYARAGRIPSVRIGRSVRFSRSQVLAAIGSPVSPPVGHS